MAFNLLDQILWMFPEKITSLYCRLDHVTTELVDDGFKLEMKFENGVNVHVEVGTSNFVNLARRCHRPGGWRGNRCPTGGSGAR